MDNKSIFKNEDEAKRFWDSRTWLIITSDERAITRYFADRWWCDFSHVSRGTGVALGYNEFFYDRLVRYERLIGSEYKWHNFWNGYIPLRIGKWIDPNMPSVRRFYKLDYDFDIVQFLSGEMTPQILDDLSKVLQDCHDNLDRRGAYTQVIFCGFSTYEYNNGEDDLLKKRAAEALLFWWLENKHLPRITPKIIMNEYTWKSLSFENKGHYSVIRLL